MRFAKLQVCALLLSAGLFSGCAIAQAPIYGAYTNVQAPLTATGENTGERTGTAECTSILGLIATGDCSIQAAMENGDITNVHHVDYETENILGLYAKFVTVVYGD